MRTITKLWILIIILVILVPIGLILPEHFKSGSAWGEWGPEKIKILIGYIPRGIERFSHFWNAPISGYGNTTIAYIMSAILGVLVVTGLIFIVGKFFSRKE